MITIDSKFNIGDEVYCFAYSNDAPKPFTVIKGTVEAVGTDISLFVQVRDRDGFCLLSDAPLAYLIESGDSKVWIPEGNIAQSKEEVISLFVDIQI